LGEQKLLTIYSGNFGCRQSTADLTAVMYARVDEINSAVSPLVNTGFTAGNTGFTVGNTHLPLSDISIPRLNAVILIS